MLERQDSEIGGRHLNETKTKNRGALAVLDPGASMLAWYHTDRIGAPDSPLFYAPKGERLRPRYSRIKWNEACQKAEISNFHPHDVRHTGLTLVARAGATNADIMRRGRHRTLASSGRYQHSGVVRDREVVDRVSALLGMHTA